MKLRALSATGCALALGALGLAAGSAHAHAVSTAYLTLDAGGASPVLGADLPLRDLAEALGIDADGDGHITWGEVRAAESRITNWVAEGVSVRRAGVGCALTAEPLALESHAGTMHAALRYSVTCPASGPWSIEYRLLFDRDRSHRALLAARVSGADAASAAVLDADRPSWREQASSWTRFVDFVRQGVWHIWLGYDHLAFLLLLLLPAVLERDRDGWVAARSRRAIALRTLGVVSAFTLAHSITLSLAALGIVTPPTVPVEASIAVTVILAGLANLVPRLAAHGARMAFGFGLIHGFGFANALRELGLESHGLAAPLAGFNIGVELGQLLVVAISLPILAILGRRIVYGRVLMPAASLAVACVAAGWLLQRVGLV